MRLLLGVLAMLLAACGTNPYREQPRDPAGAPGSDRYELDQDRGPYETVSVDHLEEPTVRDEPRSRYGNGPTYQVWGKTYTVMDSARGYAEDGIASWYGKKFHGHRTSSGETYDMYQLSAAHKTLPLPTWVRVTNLDNGKSTIVRVNDRGPFHDDRLIDLSWAAAAKLGIDQQGTGRVRVQALSAEQKKDQGHTVAAATSSPPPPSDSGLYLQVGAFSAAESAQALVGDLMQQFPWAVSVRPASPVYRVWVGPFATETDRLRARETLGSQGYTDVINAP